MHRHRIAAALVVAGLPTLAAVPGPATAETVYHGPKCADITDGAALYDASGVHARMILGATACRNVTYTLTITDLTSSTVLTTATGIPATSTTGDPAVTFDTAVADPTSADGVCVYVTTGRGKKVFDRAPDAGCVPLTVDGGAGGQGFH